ncbi:MAG: hypothetical protein G3W64_12015, partial [Xanthomonas euvesicatoria]|nr:hypothetical protein [Xanthomonas euvesicatoria]
AGAVVLMSLESGPLISMLILGASGLGLLEHGDDLAVGKAGLLHGTSSGKGTRKFHFWRLLIGGGITLPAISLAEGQG